MELHFGVLTLEAVVGCSANTWGASLRDPCGVLHEASCMAASQSSFIVICEAPGRCMKLHLGGILQSNIKNGFLGSPCRVLPLEISLGRTSQGLMPICQRHLRNCKKTCLMFGCVIISVRGSALAECNLWIHNFKLTLSWKALKQE